MNWLEGAGTVAQLLAGGAVGVLLSQAYENYRFIQNRTLGLRGDWLGEWQTLDLGEEDRWEPAKVDIRYRLGWISVAFQPSQENRAWKARLKSTPDHGLAGRWKFSAKSAEGEGSIALIVSQDGGCCFGALLGVNNAGQRRIQNIVLARDAAQLRRAKAIFYPAGTFAEEQILEPLEKSTINIIRRSSTATSFGSPRVWTSASTSAQAFCSLQPPSRPRQVTSTFSSSRDCFAATRSF